MFLLDDQPQPLTQSQGFMIELHESSTAVVVSIGIVTVGIIVGSFVSSSTLQMLASSQQLSKFKQSKVH